MDNAAYSTLRKPSSLAREPWSVACAPWSVWAEALGLLSLRPLPECMPVLAADLTALAALPLLPKRLPLLA